MIRLEVFTFDMHRLGVINKYSSISYEEKFADVGTFELTCPVDYDTIELLKRDRVLWIEDDVAGIIQYINKTSDGEKQITVKGNLLSIVLDWRYVYPCFVGKGSPIDIVEKIVDTHCINPTNGLRKLPYMCIEHNDTQMQSITFQKTGGSVKLSCDKLAEANNIGYKVAFNPRLKNPLIFKVLVGVDHSVNSKNKHVAFSQTLNNILNGEYSYNDENYRNVAFVAGEAVNNADDNTGSSTEDNNVKRTTFEVDNSNGASGYSRKELYVDARDLQSEYTEERKTVSEDGETVIENVEKVMTPEEYKNTLIQRGNENLSDCQIEESYQCQLRTDVDTNFRYGIDYKLGDKVTVFDEEINVRIDAVVTQMKVTYDKDGYCYEPVFGYDIPTILEKVKKINVDVIS